ncbi:hypothetical protein ASC61_09130 [Aeromicrobium sp. Root344]|uniref:hypothetical protein n=1 Tax=Aeromicrobium sp. Root344 TaxID=1736521 RepID=UPI0006F7FF6C|nr:hypothetical protein [Aeromicrobium sp. Root344]KQV75152.1 hypothetical protein ASC61_09130 [Aeromicrobium sp. Root344]
MFRRSRTRFELRHRGSLTPPVAGERLDAFSVDHLGRPVMLWGGDGIAAVQVADRDAVVLQEWPPSDWTLQPLPDGRFVVVGSRAEWRDGLAEDNAYVYASDGSLELAGCLGDGIEHVQTSADGGIWVGYFDEGIFGNDGWGSPGPEPIGSAGIVRFSSDLQVRWEYPAQQQESIDDCYALNVTGGDVWACPYSSFDVVRIRDGAVRRWVNDVTGATAIVVSGDSVALFGGYQDRDRLVVGSLGDDELDVQATGRLTMPDGRRLPEDTFVVGRGAELHALVGSDWFSWSLDQA